MRTIAILALDGVIAFDLATPLEIFGRSRLPNGQPAYRVFLCSREAEVDAGAFRLHAPWPLERLAEADTILLPGQQDPFTPLPEDIKERLREAAAQGTRLASICVGAFPLAATGLLDGLRATTHWQATAELARRFPRIQVDPDVLFVDNGQLLTSAGAAAGLDMCLHLVRRDFGAAVAADTARLAVMPLERAGGQAQFIVPAPPTAGGSLEPLLRWMENHAQDELTLAQIAAQGQMSVRTLNRHFREQTGTTPLRWLYRTRLHHAQTLLESTDDPIERIARQAGFGSPATFRERFQRTLGVSPLTYRRTFRGSSSI
jgi:transcriptional regulator GlxA family with amidase domain